MLTIAVSGINAMENPGPGTGIIRSLRASNLDVRIVGLAYDAMEPGIYLDHLVDTVYLMPYPSAGTLAYADRLAHIHLRESLDAVIPALDTELPVFMNNERALAHAGIKMLIPDRRMYRRRNKTRLAKLAHLLEVETPAAVVCSSRSEFTAAIDRVGFPCMVKGPFYGAHKANCHIEAQNAFYKTLNTWGYPVIVQEFIAGEEYDVVGCGDGHGGDLGLFAIKKLVTTTLGKVWTAVSVRNKQLTKTAQRFVTGLSWRGGFELELEWRAGRPVAAELRSHRGGPCVLRLPDGVRLLEGPPGSTADPGRPQRWLLPTAAGGRYPLRFGD